MRGRKLFTWLLLFLLNLVNVLAIDPFSPFFGLTSLAELYASAPGFIDSILYLVFFISLSLFALTKFYRDKWGETNKQGKTVAIVLGIALAIAASIWSSTSDFSLASLGFLSALMFLGFIFLFLHNILNVFLGRNSKFATYIIIYFIAFLTFPAFGEWLGENANWLMVIMSLLFLISVIALVTSFLKGVNIGRSRISGNDYSTGDINHDERFGDSESDVRDDEDLNIDRDFEGRADEGIEPEYQLDKKEEILDELSDLRKLLNKSLKISSNEKIELNVSRFTSKFIFSKHPPKLANEVFNRSLPIIEHLKSLKTNIIRGNYQRTNHDNFNEFIISYDKIKKAEPHLKNLGRIIGGIDHVEEDRTIIRYAKGAYLDIKKIIRVKCNDYLDKEFDLIMNKGVSNSKELNKMIHKKIGNLDSEEFKEFLASSSKNKESVIQEIKDEIEERDLLDKDFMNLIDDKKIINEINLIRGNSWNSLFKNPKKLSFIMGHTDLFDSRRISIAFKCFNMSYNSILNLNIELENMKRILDTIKKTF